MSGGSSSVSRASVFVEGVGNDICCPFVDLENNLFYVLQDSGGIIAIDQSGETERIHSTDGQQLHTNYRELYVRCDTICRHIMKTSNVS